MSTKELQDKYEKGVKERYPDAFCKPIYGKTAADTTYEIVPVQPDQLGTAPIGNGGSEFLAWLDAWKKLQEAK